MPVALIRNATEADIPSISAIYNDAVIKTTATYDYETEPLERRQAWFRDHLELKLPMIVAVSDSHGVVGWSSLSPFHKRPGFRFTVENSIYIAEPHRGKGIGKKLLAPLITAGESLGLHSIIAAIDATNEASVWLHQQFGFKEVGRFPQVGFKFNRWLDLVYLLRRLE